MFYFRPRGLLEPPPLEKASQPSAASAPQRIRICPAISWSTRIVFTPCPASPSQLAAWHESLLVLVWEACARYAPGVRGSSLPNIGDFYQPPGVLLGILFPPPPGVSQ